MSDRQERRDHIFEKALELVPSERKSFLLEACGDDLTLREEVDSLLDAHHRMASTFLQAPAHLPPGDGPDLAPGDVLCGRFEVEALLGAGGMGQVYRVQDHLLNRLVAMPSRCCRRVRNCIRVLSGRRAQCPLCPTLTSVPSTIWEPATTGTFW